MSRLLFILFIANNLMYSQVNVGLKYDLNGLPLNGYFDILTYSPKKKLSITHNSDSYEVGYYFDQSGKKVTGLIKFQDKKIWFKKEHIESSDKIKPEEIQHFVIGLDSFFTISKYYYKNLLKTKPVYVQYISDFDNKTFAKHYHFRKTSMGQSSIIESFLVKTKSSDTWDNFPDNKKFKEKALKYFGQIPYLKKKISSGDYKSDDMLSIVKMAEYYIKYKNSKTIYFDKYWQETKVNVKYSAKILNKQDSIWTFEYFNDGVKIYQANYSSFYPNMKNGDFISYYPNGKIRQIISYENNKPKEIKNYRKSGSLYINYKNIERTDENSSIQNTEKIYITVIDSLGNNILSSKNKSTLNMYDTFNNVNYTSVFESGKISSYYRLNGTDTVFQITNPGYDFKIKKLQKKFTSFMYEKKYEKALSINAQGIILVNVLIDKEGYVVQSSVLNGIHPEIDKLVENFIKSRLLKGAKRRYKFKPFKKENTNRYHEVVIPIEFSINKFYRQPANYNHYYNMHWQMHHQIMHHHKMNSF